MTNSAVMAPMLKHCLFVAMLLAAQGLILTLPGCAVCKSTDSLEVCRTKERNHSQPRVEHGY